MKWNPVKTGQSVLDAMMLALKNALDGSEKYLPTQGVTRTTNATVTTLYAATIPVDTSVGVHGFVLARRTGGSSGSANDGAFYEVKFGAKNTSGTAAFFSGSGTVTTIGESQAGWDVTLTASGGTILVRVTGAANNNVTWVWSGKMLTVEA